MLTGVQCAVGLDRVIRVSLVARINYIRLGFLVTSQVN